MKTYISILRGINVGGRNAIRMDALRQMYSRLGFENVQSYIQSGNVIFSCKPADSKSMEKLIASGIFNTFGFEVPVVVMTAAELASILANNPFSADPNRKEEFIHLTFLSDQPEPGRIEKIIPENYKPDEFCIAEKVAYLYCPGGYGNTRLSNTFFEKKLGVTATTRNLKSSNELLKMAEGL